MAWWHKVLKTGSVSWAALAVAKSALESGTRRSISQRSSRVKLAMLALGNRGWSDRTWLNFRLDLQAAALPMTYMATVQISVTQSNSKAAAGLLQGGQMPKCSKAKRYISSLQSSRGLGMTTVIQQKGLPKKLTFSPTRGRFPCITVGINPLIPKSWESSRGMEKYAPTSFNSCPEPCLAHEERAQVTGHRKLYSVSRTPLNARGTWL